MTRLTCISLTNIISHFPGAFVEGLEYASDKKAEVVGKPEKKFFHEAVSDLGSEPKRTVMIGDVSCNVMYLSMSSDGFMGLPSCMIFKIRGQANYYNI